jgi:hypothetical protein
MNHLTSPPVIIVSIVGLVILFMMCFPKYTSFYTRGVNDTYEEAYKRGFMTRSYGDYNTPIYKWKQTNVNR